MSLEDVVAANTAAVQALTAAFLSKTTAVMPATQLAPTPPLPAAPLGAAVPGGPARPGSPPAGGPAKPRGRPPGAAAAVATPPALPPAGPAIPGQTATQAAALMQIQHAGYEAVAASIQRVCEALGNKVGLSILAQFNVTHGRQLTAEQYPLVVQMCNEALAGAAQGTLA